MYKYINKHTPTYIWAQSEHCEASFLLAIDKAKPACSMSVAAVEWWALCSLSRKLYSNGWLTWSSMREGPSDGLRSTNSLQRNGHGHRTRLESLNIRKGRLRVALISRSVRRKRGKALKQSYINVFVRLGPNNSGVTGALAKLKFLSAKQLPLSELVVKFELNVFLERIIILAKSKPFANFLTAMEVASYIRWVQVMQSNIPEELGAFSRPE